MQFYIILLVVVGVCFLFLFFKYKKYESLVKENSVKLIKLKKLNSSYSFNENVKKKITIDHYVMSKTELSKVNFSELIIQLISDNTQNIKLNLEYITENEGKFEVYSKKYNAIDDVTPGDVISITNMKLKTFNFLENKFFKINKLKPVVSFKVVISAKFEESKGKNKYHKEHTFSYSDLKKYYNEILETE